MNPPRQKRWSILLQSVAEASHSALVLVSGLWLLASLPAHAIVDKNDNGMSDLWEKQYNHSNLFQSNFDPQAEPDGDGWTNEQEAAAGTDPFDGNSPAGIVSPAITHTPAVYTTDTSGNPAVLTPEAITVAWPTIAGKQYTLLYSMDLSDGSWQPLEEPFIGNGGMTEYDIPITQPDGTLPDKIFWRVTITDTDTDQDGVTDAEEAMLGSNSLKPDTDDDGMLDEYEASYGMNPLDDGTLDPANGPLGDVDNDGSNNITDAMPSDPVIDWERTAEPQFVVVELPVEDTENYGLTDFSENGSVLLTRYPADLPPSHLLIDQAQNSHQFEGYWPNGGLGAEIGTFVSYARALIGDKVLGDRLLSAPGHEGGIAEECLWDPLDDTYTPYQAEGYHDDILDVRGDFWVDSINVPPGALLKTPSGPLMSSSANGLDYSSVRIEKNGSISSDVGYWKYNADSNSYGDRIPRDEFSTGSSATLTQQVHSTIPGQSPAERHWNLLPDANGLKVSKDDAEFTKSVALTQPYSATSQGWLLANHKIWSNGKWRPLRETLASSGTQDATLLEMHDTGVGIARLENGTGPKKLGLLFPIEIVSRDKFLAGSFHIPEAYDDLEMEFGGPENLGRYGDLLGGGATKIFNTVDELLTSPPAAQPADQKVWFVKDPSDSRKIRFYTCYTTVGEVQIKLHLNTGSSAQPTLVTHQLKAAPDFAKIIAYVDRWVKGSSFTGPDASTTWLAMNTTNIVGELANQTRACLIPFFDIIDQVHGFTPLVMGLCDGVRAGWKDDKEFLALIANGTVNAGGWVKSHAAAEIEGWSGDPDERVEELKKILHDLCTKVVLPSLTELGENFTTWEGFRNKAWNAWHKTWKSARDFDLALKVVPAQAAQWLIEGLIEWGDDFCTRMMTGTEKSAWSTTQWDTGPLLSEVILYRNQAYYTFGYTFGYLGEQCATAAISAGTITVGKIIAKNGTSMINKLGPRALGAVAVRLNYLKEALANGTLLDDGTRLAYDGMMSSAAREPISPLIKEVPLTMMENRMASQTFARATFNFKEWLAAAVKNGNIRKLISKAGSEAVLSKRTAQLMHLLGDECDDVTMKNFMKVAEERLIIGHPDGTVDEYFEGFFRAFEGNSSLANNLEDPAHSIASLSSGAKARLKAFLSDPNPGYLWKIDDPAFVNGVPQVPQNYWARGVLGELDVFNRIYKKQGYTHAPSAEGYDIFGPKWVQIKTTVNPSSSGNIQAMRNAIDDLVDKSPLSSALKLHILKKPGTDSAALQSALQIHIDTPLLRNRVEILIQPYNIGPQ